MGPFFYIKIHAAVMAGIVISSTTTTKTSHKFKLFITIIILIILNLKVHFISQNFLQSRIDTQKTVQQLPKNYLKR